MQCTYFTTSSTASIVQVQFKSSLSVQLITFLTQIMVLASSWKPVSLVLKCIIARELTGHTPLHRFSTPADTARGGAM